MKNKTKITLERFETSKYRLIVEGIGLGLLTGLLVSSFRMGLEQAESLRGSVLLAVKTGGVRGLAIALAGMACAYIAVWYCSRKVPLCTGSGIPQVKGELLGQMEQNWWQVICAKFVGGICAIGAGLSLGREGPSIQLGAMVGKGFSRLSGRLRTEEKMLMTCGAGAGLAGAFGAPLAGVVFSLEELHKNFSTEILLSTMAASIASDFVSSYIFGLSPVFGLSIEGKMPLARYWMIILLGAMLGVFGVFYNWVTAKVQDAYDKLPRRSMRIAVPFICVIGLAAFFPYVLGSGHGLVTEVADGYFGLSMLATLLVLKFCFSMISFGSGVPGGIFLPLLVLGAISGGLFAEGTGQVLGFENSYLANFVILGMAGMFSSIVRAPITGVILITEMSGDFKNFLSLATVALAAYIVADPLRGKPIYDQLLERMLSKGKAYGTTEETRGHKVLMEAQVYIGSRMDGEKIEKMLLPAGCLVVSVEREHKEIVPGGSTVLRGGDKLILLCAQGDVQKVEEKLDNICRKIKM
ncbi:MAG: ClC family H(+)/Cl(-) exchange transporter [Emergencia sp.]|nr:ClC family H(+)/Cl(-) exchange transporter [Emergencia sp.]